MEKDLRIRVPLEMHTAIRMAAAENYRTINAQVFSALAACPEISAHMTTKPVLAKDDAQQTPKRL